MKQDDAMDAGMEHNALRREAPVAGKPDPVTTGLQRLFAAIADEPIPDEFLKLLDEIDSRGKGTTQ